MSKQPPWCDTHQGYMAFRKPQSNCTQCWVIWIKKQLEKKVEFT